MKVCKALKVLSITASLLGSSFPVYAQETSSGGGWFSTWKSWISGGEKEEATHEEQPSLGSIRPKRRPDIRTLSQEEGYENYRRNIDINQLICTGNIPQVQLMGVDDLMLQISSACNVDNVDDEYRNAPNQNSLAFCHEINNRYGDGTCFGNIINDSSTDFYQNQFYNNPEVREKFAQEIKDQLLAEREKMNELRSLQFTIANDPLSLIDLKDELYNKIRNNDEAYEEFKRMFHVEESVANKVKDGSIPLSEFSDAIFQCTPDNIKRRETGNPYDESFVDACDSSAANDLLDEVKDELISEPGASLAHGRLAQGAIDFYDEIDDEYKMMTNAVNQGFGRGTDDEMKEMMSTVYLEDAKLILSAMDAQRGNNTNIALVNSIHNIMNDDNLNEDQKSQRIRGESLRQTVSSLSLFYKDDSINTRIIEAIQSDLIVDSPDGVPRLNFGDRNAMEVISHINERSGLSAEEAGLDEEELTNRIGTIAKLVSSGMTFGSKLYEGQKFRDQMTGSISGSLLPPKPGTEMTHNEDSENDAKNAIIDRFEEYLNRSLGSENGQRQFGKIQSFISNQKEMSGVCETPIAEAKANLVGVAALLAQDCNSLINRDKRRVAHQYCPNLVNPMNANVMLQGILSDSSAMEGNSQNTISNVIIACTSMEFDAIVKDFIRSGSQDGGASEARVAAGNGQEIACDYINAQGTISSENNNRFRDALCGAESIFSSLDDGLDLASSSSIFGFGAGPQVRVPVPAGSSIDVVKSSEKSYKDLISGSDSKGRILGQTGSSSLFDTYNGKAVGAPGVSSVGAMVNDGTTGAVASSGINSNIFSTNNVSTPITNSSFVPNSENNDESDELISSEGLRREMEDSNGGIDPNIQKILDKMAAMEEREKSLIDEQNKLRNLINSPTDTAGVEEDELDQSKSDLAAVTAELDALKKEMSSLVTDARNENKNAQKDNYRVSNFSRPSASPTPSSSQRGPASVGSSFNGNSIGASSGQLPSSSSPSSGGSIANAGGKGYSAGGGILGNVSPDGLSAPAYTQNETFVLTQSIRDKAPIMPAGVSIEQAVLENKGAILVPYGNGQYMYVEPELSENGDILTRDGRVVYKEVLKISDPEVIASRTEESGDRAPASVEEFDPSEKIYDWDDFSRQLDEAQN